MFAALTLAALAPAVAASANVELQPAAIFERAQQTWQARVVPPYESFRVDCAATFLQPKCGSGDVVEFVVRNADGRTYARRLPADGSAPSVLMQGGYITGPAGTPLGFYRTIAATPAAPAPTAPPNLAPDPLQSIATVSANGHVYDVALAGEETIGERRCYHLALRPELDPDRYPLRDVWVDTSSFQVVQLVYARPYEKHGARASVLYRFDRAGSQRLWTIVRIEARAGRESVADDLRDIAFPARVPDWYFESRS